MTFETFDQSDEKTCPRYLRHSGASETHEMTFHGALTLTYKHDPSDPARTMSMTMTVTTTMISTSETSEAFVKTVLQTYNN